MNLKQTLTLAAEKLASLKDIDAPTFEAEVLLRYALNLSRTALHLNLNQELSADQFAHFFKWVERRLQGEPTSYIIGQREFFGLEFYIDKRVLIPRPETELLVEEALKFVKNHPVQTIADIGTGSGAIAVSLAVNLFNLRSSFTKNQAKSPINGHEVTHSGTKDDNSKRLLREKNELAKTGYIPGQIQIYATDISGDALEVARLNAQKHGVVSRITFLQGDLLEPLPQPADIIIANLPYVSAAEVKTMPSAQFEPVVALDGGESGLDQIFRLADQLKGKVNPGGCVLLEIGIGQAKAVSDYLRRIFPEAVIEVFPDLSGIERVVKVKLQIRNHK